MPSYAVSLMSGIDADTPEEAARLFADAIAEHDTLTLAVTPYDGPGTGAPVMVEVAMSWHPCHGEVDADGICDRCEQQISGAELEPCLICGEPSAAMLCPSCDEGTRPDAS